MPENIPTTSMAGSRTTGVQPAVFFHAHQDDETLTLGPAIEEHVNAGRHVICVLVTDGSASYIRSSLNMTYERFSAERDRELVDAYRALGVTQWYAEGMQDGQLTLDQARAIIWKWTARFPGASFKAPSFIDASPDHARIGQALRERAQTVTLDARWYVKRDDRSRFLSMGRPYATVTGGPRTLAALSEYRSSPYHIGYTSVPDDFDGQQADNTTLMHYLW